MEQKEGFCTVCSIPVPSAFSNDDGNDNDDENYRNNKFKKILNSCNIPIFLIIAFTIYIIFFYKK
jgi:hypothetical protein